MGSPWCQLGRCRDWRAGIATIVSTRDVCAGEAYWATTTTSRPRAWRFLDLRAASRILKLATSPTPLNPELEEHRRPVNEMGVQPGADLCGRRAPAFDLDQITSLVGDFGRGGVLEIVDDLRIDYSWIVLIAV